jgi:predicted Zn-dependent protease
MSIWDEVLGWGPGQIQEVRTLAYSYARQGLYSMARELLHMNQILVPNDPYEAQLLGAIYLEEGQLKKAVRWLERAVELDPRHEPSRLNQAKALFETGKAEQATALAQSHQLSQDPRVANNATALLLAYAKAA